MIAGIPGPPQWAIDVSTVFLTHVATPLYVLLTVASFAVWGVLRWQRKPGETWAAKSFRAFVFAKGWLWFVLAITRWIGAAWRLPLYDVVILYILGTTIYVLVALVATYVVPVLRGRGPPPLEGSVIPESPQDWDGDERRHGPQDRRGPPTATA